MNENQITSQGISIKELLYAILSKFYIVILFAVVAGIIAFIKVSFFTDDVYQTKGVLLVINEDMSQDIEKTQFTASDVDSSRSLCESCVELLNDRGFQTMVSEKYNEKFDKNCSPEWVGSRITVTRRNETDLLDLHVAGFTDNEAKELADCAMEVAPKYIESVYNADIMNHASDPYLPKSPNSRGVFKNTLLGMVVGMLIAVVLIILAYYFDDKVHNADEISARYNVPILGDFDD